MFSSSTLTCEIHLTKRFKSKCVRDFYAVETETPLYFRRVWMTNANLQSETLIF